MWERNGPTRAALRLLQAALIAVAISGCSSLKMNVQTPANSAPVWEPTDNQYPLALIFEFHSGGAKTSFEEAYFDALRVLVDSPRFVADDPRVLQTELPEHVAAFVFMVADVFPHGDEIILTVRFYTIVENEILDTAYDYYDERDRWLYQPIYDRGIAATAAFGNPSGVAEAVRSLDREILAYLESTYELANDLDEWPAE